MDGRIVSEQVGLGVKRLTFIREVSASDFGRGT